MIILSMPLDEENTAEQPHNPPGTGVLLSDEPTIELVIRARAGTVPRWRPCSRGVFRP